jgi:hypothetical protein
MESPAKKSDAFRIAEIDPPGHHASGGRRPREPRAADPVVDAEKEPVLEALDVDITAVIQEPFCFRL